MAGYSGTSLASKLGIKEGHAIAIVGSRDGLHNVEGLPDHQTWSGLRLVIRRENR